MILNSEASPKAISERTSYLQVRLEFLRYPHLIPHFSTYVGSVLQCVSPTFNLDMGRSHGFGSTTTYLFALFRLAFAAAPSLRLNLACNRTRRFILQKARHHSLTSFDLLSHGFRIYFTPLPGLLFTFPSRYWFTIGH